MLTIFQMLTIDPANLMVDIQDNSNLIKKCLINQYFNDKFFQVRLQKLSEIFTIFVYESCKLSYGRSKKW